jgi:hypothetical protein
MKEKPDGKVGSNPEIPVAAVPTRARAPNPRRVLAGRLNRQKRGQLTPQGREILRQTARRRGFSASRKCPLLSRATPCCSPC